MPAKPAVANVLPLVVRAPDGRWRGLGHYGARYLDLTGNKLGDEGVAALVRALVLTKADVAAAAAAVAAADDTRKSPTLGKSVRPGCPLLVRASGPALGVWARECVWPNGCWLRSTVAGVCEATCLSLCMTAAPA